MANNNTVFSRVALTCGFIVVGIRLVKESLPNEAEQKIGVVDNSFLNGVVDAVEGVLVTTVLLGYIADACHD